MSSIWVINIFGLKIQKMTKTVWNLVGHFNQLTYIKINGHSINEMLISEGFYIAQSTLRPYVRKKITKKAGLSIILCKFKLFKDDLKLCLQKISQIMTKFVPNFGPSWSIFSLHPLSLNKVFLLRIHLKEIHL